jgi:hypothetical protein
MYSNNTQSIGGECRALQVPSAIADMQATANRVADLASLLGKRLDPVLSPSPPANSDGSPKSIGYSTPTASAIQSGEFTLRHAESVLADLLDRLEV